MIGLNLSYSRLRDSELSYQLPELRSDERKESNWDRLVKGSRLGNGDQCKATPR